MHLNRVGFHNILETIFHGYSSTFNDYSCSLGLNVKCHCKAELAMELDVRCHVAEMALGSICQTSLRCRCLKSDDIIYLFSSFNKFLFETVLLLSRFQLYFLTFTSVKLSSNFFEKKVNLGRPITCIWQFLRGGIPRE